MLKRTSIRRRGFRWTAQERVQWQPKSLPSTPERIVRVTIIWPEYISILYAYHKTSQESTWSRWKARSWERPTSWYCLISFALIIKKNQLASFSLQWNDWILPCNSDSGTEIPLFSIYGISSLNHHACSLGSENWHHIAELGNNFANEVKERGNWKQAGYTEEDVDSLSKPLHDHKASWEAALEDH